MLLSRTPFLRRDRAVCCIVVDSLFSRNFLRTFPCFFSLSWGRVEERGSSSASTSVFCCSVISLHTRGNGIANSSSAIYPLNVYRSGCLSSVVRPRSLAYTAHVLSRRKITCLSAQAYIFGHPPPTLFFFWWLCAGGCGAFGVFHVRVSGSKRFAVLRHGHPQRSCEGIL